MTSQVAHPTAHIEARGANTSDESSSSRRMQVMSHDSTSGTVLPELRNSGQAIDKFKPLPTSLQSDFIPEDMLLALAHPPSNFNKLGPPNRYRNLGTSSMHARRAYENVWNNPKQREKFRHLTENPPCICGAGKDVSFLYDVAKKEVPLEVPNMLDPSSQRIQSMDDDEAEDEEKKCPRCHGYVYRKLAIPDSLIPEEYHIVKNKGVMGLEYNDKKFGSQPKDHEKHLVIFPSLKPVSRFEVQQLRKTMLEMLDDMAIRDGMDPEGPTQMHNLLDLIKKEQDVYNIIFHEIIRQVSVECTDRGELLSELRSKYSNLLNKVPMQIKGLHEEVLAQRALDRRLTEELLRFKHSIVSLTAELHTVKEHDTQVTQQATSVKDQLQLALNDAAKNANLLAEYHDLYELQRARLECSVASLHADKEIWSAAAYSLALKVTDENNLNTAKRLHIAEKAWVKIATHFTIFLSHKDTDTLTELQGFVDRFRDHLDELNRYLLTHEDVMRVQLAVVKKDMKQWHNYFHKYILSKDGRHLMRALDHERVLRLYNDMKNWEGIIGKQSEQFCGEMFFGGEDAIHHIREEMDGWTHQALKVFKRHHVDPDHISPDQDFMKNMNKKYKTSLKNTKRNTKRHLQDVERLLKQFNLRLTGENGTATSLIHLSNSFDTWLSRFWSKLHSSTHIHDQEWLRFSRMLDDWVKLIDGIIDGIGSPLREEDTLENVDEENMPLSVSEVMKITQNWLTTTINGIDNEDSRLVQMVMSLHTEMVQWMVHVLLHLAPNREGHSQEALVEVLSGTIPIRSIEATCTDICKRLYSFSTFVSCCLADVVSTQQSQDDVESERKELNKLMNECKDWMMTAHVLLSELTGEPTPETLILPATAANQQPSINTKTLDGMAHTQASFDSIVATEDGKDSPQSLGDQYRTMEVLMTTPVPVEQKDTSPKASPRSASHQWYAGTRSPGTKSPGPKSPDTKSPRTRSPRSPMPQNATVLKVIPEPVKEETREQDEQQEEAQSEPQPPPEPKSPALQVLGFDANTYSMDLQDIADQTALAAGRKPVRALTQQPRQALLAEKPQTPNTIKAFVALAAVGELKQQLMSTEERAQAAEQKATDYALDLNNALEKIRALERHVDKLTPGSKTPSPDIDPPSLLSPSLPPSSTSPTLSHSAASPTPSSSSRPSKTKKRRGSTMIKSKKENK